MGLQGRVGRGCWQRLSLLVDSLVREGVEPSFMVHDEPSCMV